MRQIWFWRLVLLALFLVPAVTAAGTARAEMAEGRVDLDEWSGSITCERGDHGFQSDRRFVLADGVLGWERGTEGEDGYERLSGVIDETEEVMLHGRYHWKEEKLFWLKGRFDGDRFSAAGRRGRKWCALSLTRDG